MLPNVLTLSRIFSIPFIVACFYIDGYFSHLIATILFIIACATDFFDGYLARQWKQVSAFGRFLDPVADKLLVSTILLMLSGVGIISGIHLIAATIILAREIIVSGLRQFMAEMKVRVPVTRYAKWKTAMQMSSITCLLFSAMFPETLTIHQLGLFLLWIAVFMTVFTGVRYMKFGAVKIANEMENQD
ncbi:MAG: CDP-diacylglycerol--glycerol-3-phosphate 3-phosphatidyltransferase [Alphaproteobacteria bacterium]|nr:CDP-diacylglycerol--glycerol-3-phosphate 3-phosphatidyltransferase [Alphaproteobacteria bacterium]MCR4556064.1 CDP-diacylglycerol--glycerol-3-phosphate 3-phosphatidyltransferase [Alphaproteobacteria bacterium]